MMYYKYVNDRQVFSDCHTIQTNEGVFVSNPSQQQIFDAGWQIYEPPVVEPQPMTEPDEMDIMQAVKRMLASSVENLTDEEALSVAALYPTWISKVGEQVNAGERLWYDGKLYKVVQGHIVQEGWTPDTAVSLFTEVTIEEWPEWVQPLGSEDAYMTGDKVTHNGIHWVSNVDSNVWEPGVYGWSEVL